MLDTRVRCNLESTKSLTNHARCVVSYELKPSGANTVNLFSMGTGAFGFECSGAPIADTCDNAEEPSDYDIRGVDEEHYVARLMCIKINRVGGSLTATALPHHRTCRSASGGSSN
jgi:hypothetical protein